MEWWTNRKKKVPIARVYFAWFDFWVGFYYNQRDMILYICPLPMLVIRIHIWKIMLRWRNRKRG